MDRLTAMRVFIEIVDRGSVTAAAGALDMSRAMASRYLEGVEDWLGARLLHRTTRRLSLTDVGEQAISRCREMLELAEEVRAQTSQGGSEAQGKLRLTTTPSFAQAQLAAAVVDFQERHLLVQVDLFVVDRAVNLVEERIDLAIRISNRVDPGLVARRLAICESVLCASPAYLARHGRPTVPNDLRKHRCITHSSGLGPEFKLRLGGQLTTVKADGNLTANETSVLRAAAVSGAGIAMLPTYYVGEDLMRGTLELVLPQYALDPLNIQAVYLSRRHQPRPLRLLIDFLSERFGGASPPWDRKVPKFSTSSATVTRSPKPSGSSPRRRRPASPG
jgi:DNA-binding transcriptional LysR family regulator